MKNINKNLEVIEKEQGTKFTEQEVIEKALKNPIASAPLSKLAEGKENIVIIISDITRSYQKPYLFLPYVVEELKKSGAKNENISFLVALGTHRKSTEEEHKFLLGELYGKYKIEDSYCDDDVFETLGTTSYGTEVQIHKKAVNADLLVLTGAIVHHDMAGFSGGRKSILPGIASRKTINTNHSLAMDDNEGIRPYVENASLDKNILHKDMEEAAKMVKPDFIFNVILDNDGDIKDAVSGDYIIAHKEGCRLVDQYSKIKVKEKRQVLYTNCGPYPKDINLYQISKAVSNGKNVLTDDGTLILIAQCSEGLGSEEMEYMFKNFKNNKEREEELRKAFTIGKYAAYLVTVVSEIKDVIVVSDILKESDMGYSNVKIMKSVEQTEKFLKEKYGEYKGYYLDSSSIYLEV